MAGAARPEADTNYAGPVTSPSPERSEPAVGADGGTTIELNVAGMHCGSCSALIEESLGEHPAVSAASVDLDSARAVVTFDASRLDADGLCAVVAEVGYSATPVG
jgi:copper chaperone